MRGLKNLRVYQAAVLYAAKIRRLLRSTKGVPPDDVEQLRQSAKSIGNNIAEGHGYGVGQNRRRVYKLARGSAQESLNQLRDLVNAGLISRKQFYAHFNLGRAIVKMLDAEIGD